MNSVARNEKEIQGAASISDFQAQAEIIEAPRPEVPGSAVPKHRILFVGSQEAGFSELRAGLEAVHPEWDVELILAGEGALQSPRGRPSVIFVDFHLPNGIAMPLMDSIRQTEPDCIRLLMGVQSPDQLLIGKCAWNGLRLFTEPRTVEAISRTIERAFELEPWLSKKRVQSLVSQLRSFPSIPSLYFKIVKEISSQNPSIETLVQLIGSDLAIHSKIVQVVNSAFYGRTDHISDLAEAIAVIGLDALQSLVVGVHAFAQMDKVKPVYFSIDSTWRHSLAVADRARQIARRHSGEIGIKEAHTAGLLHDIGKVVFACNLDSEYRRVLSIAAAERISLFKAERDILGATHADVGAYLGALWNLPKSVVEAIALHHEPEASNDGAFSPLTAVYLANAMEHQKKQSLVCPAPHSAYLKRLGLDEYIEIQDAQTVGQDVTAAQQPSPPEKPLPASDKAADVRNGIQRSRVFAIACLLAVGAATGLIFLWLRNWI